MGIPAMDFLVLPRMLALALMMPLLGVYADLLGVLGGAVVGIGMLDLGSAEYYYRTIQAIGLDDFAAGIVKASVFGVLVAIAGCLRGKECRSPWRSEEHTSELQSRPHLVCRLLLE